MLNDQQYQQLLKPLNPQRVAKRQQAGRSLSYLEAWDVKAHLIRIFGFGGWSWNVQSVQLAFEEQNEKGQWNVGYRVIGCLRLDNLYCSYTEAAVGSATLPQRGEAHDMAVKTAESDALKRAAINLGTQFGLGLYDNGSLSDVVGRTLDRNTPDTPAAADAPEDPARGAPAPSMTVISDNEGSGAWIEEMRAAVEDKDVSLLVEIKQRMNTENVNDWVYQGVTLAKWHDKAMITVGKQA